MGTGTFDLVYDNYVELACSLMYDNGVSYKRTMNTFTFPVIAIMSDDPVSVTGMAPTEYVFIHSNASGYGTQFTFDIWNNKVNIKYIVNNSSKGAVYGKLK